MPFGSTKSRRITPTDVARAGEQRRLRIAAPAIRLHHERLDGSGYPDQLTDEQIPIEARIIAVADVWAAPSPPTASPLPP